MTPPGKRRWLNCRRLPSAAAAHETSGNEKNEKKIPWKFGKSGKKIYLCNVRKDKGSDRDSLNFLGKEIWNLVNILTQTL